MATYEWEQFTLGQNSKIAEIASAASNASELLNTNIKLAKTGLSLAQVFLKGIINPKIVLLGKIADAIDNFTNDFKGTGFYILEVIPTGKEVIPKDANGDHLKIVSSSVEITANWVAAQADGRNTAFLNWAEEFLGESDFAATGATKKEYYIPQGKSKPEDERDENANDDTISDIDPITGLHKMTPSQVIGQMIGAMDDELDDRRPTFSADSDVGAVVIIIGFSDLSNTLPKLNDAVNTFKEFFGGDNGLIIGGTKQIGNLIAGALGALEDTTKNNVTFTVRDICGVRGTEFEKRQLKRGNVPYNIPAEFEVGDYVVGPLQGFAGRAKGYVTSAETISTSGIYATQKLVIAGASEPDARAFRAIGNGAKLQKVHYFKNQRGYIDQNSGKSVAGPFYNDYKYFTHMTDEEAKTANTKVTRKSKESLLTVLKTEDVTERHSVSVTGGTLGFTSHNTIIGTIFESTDKKVAPPPNFKSAKLEDLLGDFKGFFEGFDILSQTLRDMAGDSSTALKGTIEFLNNKIKKLDELNAKLQAILKTFNIGLPSGGVYTLVIAPAPGGNDFIKKTLQSASNRPPDDLDFSLGYLIMGGSASTKVLTSLLAPSG